MTSFPGQLGSTWAPPTKPRNAWLRSGERGWSVGTIVAQIESGTVALHSCRKTSTALMPSGDRVEFRATLLQLTNPSIPGEAKRGVTPITAMAPIAIRSHRGGGGGSLPSARCTFLAARAKGVRDYIEPGRAMSPIAPTRTSGGVRLRTAFSGHRGYQIRLIMSTRIKMRDLPVLLGSLSSQSAPLKNDANFGSGALAAVTPRADRR